jgi:hypothetical protein
MGMKLFSDSSTPSKALPNPDPFKYEVKALHEVNGNLIALIHYPDCTTFNGLKLMVYKGLKKNEFIERSKILGCDPHFLENKLSPFARFVPTEDGFKEALLLCDNQIGRKE